MHIFGFNDMPFWRQQDEKKKVKERVAGKSRICNTNKYLSKNY